MIEISDPSAVDVEEEPEDDGPPHMTEIPVWSDPKSNPGSDSSTPQDAGGSMHYEIIHDLDNDADEEVTTLKIIKENPNYSG